MEKKIVFILTAILLTLIIIVVIFSKKISFSQTELEECKVLSYYGEGKTNIVFFSSEETARKYSNFLLEIEPFYSNKNEFNFFYLDYKPKCEIYKEIALLCYSKELIKKAGSCPNDFIVVVSEQDKKIRSSSYMNVLSLNSKHPLTVFPHEFGHAFAFLADEYVPSNLPKKSKNCVSDCEKFLGIEYGCFQGCSKSEYLRSINNGIMRALSSEEYGRFNENLISEKMSKEHSALTGKAIEEKKECFKEKYYLIEGTYLQEKIDITEKALEQGCVGKNGFGEFEYNIIMKNGSIIYTEEFNPELIFTDTETNERKIEGSILKNEGPFLLKIPIIPGSKTLRIIKDDKTITEVNLYDINSRPCKK